MDVKITIACPFCNGETILVVPAEEYDAYKKSGDTTVFTTLTDDQIETLSTGACDKCIGCCDSDDCNCVDLSNSKNVNNWEDDEDEDEEDDLYFESFDEWELKDKFLSHVDDVIDKLKTLECVGKVEFDKDTDIETETGYPEIYRALITIFDKNIKPICCVCVNRNNHKSGFISYNVKRNKEEDYYTNYENDPRYGFCFGNIEKVIEKIKLICGSSNSKDSFVNADDKTTRETQRQQAKKTLEAKIDELYNNVCKELFYNRIINANHENFEGRNSDWHNMALAMLEYLYSAVSKLYHINPPINDNPVFKLSGLTSYQLGNIAWVRMEYELKTRFKKYAKEYLEETGLRDKTDTTDVKQWFDKESDEKERDAYVDALKAALWSIKHEITHGMISIFDANELRKLGLEPLKS